MSSRSLIILVTSVIAFILMTPIILFALVSILSPDPNVLAFVISFFAALLIFFVLFFISNKLIANSAEGNQAVNQGKELTFTLDKEYKEVVLNVNYEIKNFKISEVSFNYEGQVLRDGVVVENIKFGLGNVNQGIVPDNAELQMSLYYKDSKEIILKDMPAGKYTLKSNKDSAPKEVKINEEVRLFQ